MAEKYQVAVMIPDTSPRGEHVPDDDGWDLGKGAGFYENATQHPWAKNYNMYTYITEELAAIASTLIPHFSGEESIMGHSMGGHGALVIGMKNATKIRAGDRRDAQDLAGVDGGLRLEVVRPDDRHRGDGEPRGDRRERFLALDRVCLDQGAAVTDRRVDGDRLDQGAVLGAIAPRCRSGRSPDGRRSARRRRSPRRREPPRRSRPAPQLSDPAGRIRRFRLCPCRRGRRHHRRCPTYSSPSVASSTSPTPREHCARSESARC